MDVSVIKHFMLEVVLNKWQNLDTDLSVSLLTCIVRWTTIPNWKRLLKINLQMWTSGDQNAN
jgi:hypothetical protein